jgi:DNA-binding transcriptional regulator GbsR (MarR family)
MGAAFVFTSMITEMMAVLGYERRGGAIVAALTSAIRQSER